MRWFIAYLKAFVATFKRPEKMTAEKRQRTIQLIKRLGHLEGMDTSVSERHAFSPEVIYRVPRQRGVYHIYEGNELQYIGATCRGLRSRLDRHLGRAHNIDTASNKRLADLIASGGATVEWYDSPFPGWMEELELIQHCEEHGGPPPLNKHRRSGLKLKCPW